MTVVAGDPPFPGSSIRSQVVPPTLFIMRSTLVPFTVALAFSATAQVVFELPTAMPVPGTHVEQAWEWNDTPIELDTIGINVTWDLSGALEPIGTRTISDSAPAGTPGAADFPNATHAHRVDGAPYTAWYYYRLDANDTLWCEGIRYDDGHLLHCAPPYLYMHFPYAFGDLAECNTICVHDGTPTDLYYNHGFEPVATGTIVHPDGTISDAVLTRFHFQGEPSGYFWFRANNALQWIGQYVPGWVLTLWTELPTGIEEAMNDAWRSAYPVPATDRVYVRLSTGEGMVSYTMHDPTGRTVLNGQGIVQDGRLALDVSAMQAGHYLVRIHGPGCTGLARISVAR